MESTHGAPLRDYSKDALWVLGLNGLRVGVVYAFYAEALRRLHPILVVCLVALEVPLTMVFEFFWLGEAQGGFVITGMLLILVGATSIIFENDRFRGGSGIDDAR